MLTIQVDGKTTIRDLAGRYPQPRPVFEKLRIDSCCGGGKCRAEAADEWGLVLPELLLTRLILARLGRHSNASALRRAVSADGSAIPQSHSPRG